jgi:single-stranded-DNA-specific exonuclease
MNKRENINSSKKELPERFVAEVDYLEDLGELSRNFFRNRGFVTCEMQQKLLNPNFELDLQSPFDFIDMEKAVSRLKKALDNNEKILIYTDYDCDGIPAATILHDFLVKLENSKNIKDNNKSFKILFENYIPHRHREGYGLHIKALEKYINEGYTLLITADLGITNIKEVKYAEGNGMNVILTDHHLPLQRFKDEHKKNETEEDLPQAYALINCQVKRENYVNKGICGAGTAWKLVNAFLAKHRDEYGVNFGWEKWLLDMVALATVADMMPLTGENRTLVHYGLKVLQKSPRVGLQKLLSLAKEKQANINEKTLSFTIAPRVNAASRLDHPMKSFYMLSGAGITESETMGYAEELELINKNRKNKVEDISKLLTDNLGEFKNDSIVFVGNELWPIGLAGLIATKIVELTGKTVFVWGIDEKGIVRGSSRSGLDKISVMELTSTISEDLLHFGGHEAAGGFSFENGKQNSIRLKLNKNYKRILKGRELVKSEVSKAVDLAYFDYEYKGENLTGIYGEQSKLAPFGIGNPAPIFKLIGNSFVREFGQNNKHIEINVKVGGGSATTIIKWNADPRLKEKVKNSKAFYANLEKDNWRNAYRFILLDCE